MYLSRVRVATEGLDKRALLSLLSGDAYANHQLLWRLFDDQPKRSFLFRQETEQDQLSTEKFPRGLPLFYVLSEAEPVDVPGLLQVESREFSPQLSAGDRLLFRFRANPTVSRKSHSGGRSARHDVLMDAKAQCKDDEYKKGPLEIQQYMETAAIKWLHDRAEKAGFALDFTPQISGYRQHILRRKKQEIRFSSIDYEGVLTVTDPARFVATLRQGLGRSKAFGCGLMMVRRA